MTDPMTLREQVAIMCNLHAGRSKHDPQGVVCADQMLALITEACAKVAEDVYGLCEHDDLKIGWRVSADMIAQRIRQMGKP